MNDYEIVDTNVDNIGGCSFCGYKDGKNEGHRRISTLRRPGFAGRLAAAAMEGIARQPNAAGDIRGAMIVAAGLIEGATFFALIVTILLAIK